MPLRDAINYQIALVNFKIPYIFITLHATTILKVATAFRFLIKNMKDKTATTQYSNNMSIHNTYGIQHVYIAQQFWI